MAKKKATMTLKDFHGGSIPSDLPLPSAPGVMVRPAERGGFDRQTSWGNSMGRSEHRLRPASSGSVRNFDEKAPLLMHKEQFGSHFDEDERKPLDAVLGPHRISSDEGTHAIPSRLAEPKMDFLSGARAGSQLASTPVSQFSSGSIGSSYAGRLTEVHNVGLKSQIGSCGNGIAGVNYKNVGGNAGQTVAGPHQNAWGVRKEAAGLREPVSTAWSAPDAASKLAHASALEKVSSGRWHSKQLIHQQNDVQLIGHLVNEREINYRGNNILDKQYDRIDAVGGTVYQDVGLAVHAERSLAVGDGVHVGGKEISPNERARSTMYMKADVRNPSVRSNEFQPVRNAVKSGGSELPSQMPLESLERPKLNLLPRSKPLENIDMIVDYKQQPSDPVHLEDVSESYRSAHPEGFAESTRTLECPKMNLKPQSQPIEQLKRDTEIKRNVVFGGARPRELVLKERGIGDAPASNYGSELFSRVNLDSPKNETVSAHAATNYNGKAENIHGDKRIVKHTDRRDNRIDVERTDSQRRNQQNESWRNKKEIEKRHNQQQGRPPSPETWRKPVEHQNPASPSATGQRYGKATSAVELAQAFSKSVSDPTVANCLSGPSGVPNRGQVPFSRLMGPTPRPQINGY
ncbi:eukaryotic translation initiation factor-related [Forsythia ovata]|uniref:Eukaryotic translation initiation factor-related n=1 Tax=Forsythia ovata TaxID=205694 RepID=A0ABD1S3G2_9LAMI